MPRSALTFPALAAAAAVLLPALASAAPVQRPGDDQGISLGLIGPTIPAVLIRAKADPYAAPTGSVCAGAREEIEALDAALGPDADTPEAKHKRIQPAKWVGQAMRSAIPHRDVVRFLSGADRKQKALYHAELAGWARRGYLKGLSAAANCAAAPELAAPLTPAASSVLDAPTAGFQKAAVTIPDVAPAAEPSSPPAPAHKSFRARTAARMVAFVR